jgi:HSP20 family protein
VPAVDVYEKPHVLVVKAELPGLKKEDVHVEIESDDLIIRGERKADRDVKPEEYYRTERTYGGFYRRMRLPGRIAPGQIQANLADGVLEVQIPIPPETKPQRR